MFVIRWLVWMMSRLVLALRYRVRVTGMESLAGLGRRDKVLILPNHPGYIDPPLVLSRLGPALDPRPLVYEGTFDNPFFWPFMKIVNALRVPDMESASASARDTARGSVQAIIEGLKAGNNHILWPSGRLQRGGAEVLGGARAVTDILQAVPDCKIVLVRTRGVWGSMYSFAPTGELPPLSKRILQSVGLVLGSLVFFLPRRRVHLTVELLDRSKLPELQRDRVNAFFEAWFNAEGVEQPTYVPYHLLFGPRTFTFPVRRSAGDADLSRVKPEVRAEVMELLASKMGRPLDPAEQKPETSLDQLGLDSLDRMELSLHLEQRFGFGTDQVPATVGQAWALAGGLVEKGPPRPAPAEWFRPRKKTSEMPLADTLPAAFVNRALRSRGEVAVADDLAGTLTYEKLLVGALTMAKRLDVVKAGNVGLMLPASVVNDVAFLALHLAGKVPVILNWTTGPSNLAHACKVAGLTHVLTSKKFLDRLALTLPGIEYLYVEDLRKMVSGLEMLRTLLAVRHTPNRIRHRTPKVDPDSPAVVLFTSGSEKAPKAVPLTHTNLLANIRGGMKALGLHHEDVLIGFLPAFHSFGLTVTTLAPLLCGMRVVHHPDPTDAGGLTRKVAGYKVTALAGTPTFISYILDRVKADELSSVRLIFVGAEKCPKSVFERCQKLAPNAEVLEGYGITECSPVVAVNTPGAVRPGTVGRPLPGVEICIIEAEGDDLVPPGKMGMLLVSGPSIFPGYLGQHEQTPFRERDGKRWYVTGDLVEEDRDGYLRFAGRLKRFIKVAGEMVSLTALEETFNQVYPPTENGPRVALEGVELEGGRGKIVLFTTEEINLRDANARLWEAGFRGVMRLDEVRRIDSIPVLGTGKVDNKVLRARVLESVG